MAQNLTTNIVINAKTGNGFSEVGSVLAEMGSIVNGISQELIQFGKESVEVYSDYEKSMTEAEVALATKYGRGTRQLGTVMDQLDAAATKWAASTIFHTDDVGNAISEAAHAGWDYEQIMQGIPAAMELAQAGSIDLSEAVDYITKATHAAGTEFEDIPQFIDHWAYAANKSATDIDGMGEAMLRMGATMQFAGDSDQLLTMLARLADAGTTGSDAGTLLRNSMLRLVAPTKKAREAMEELGAEGDEIEEILNDEALAAANAMLQTKGFSAYDDRGNLKGMLEIFTDLDKALEGMSEEDRNNILSSIFPTRSITGAMALLKAAKDEYGGLYEELQNGAAEGYGEYAQGEMMDTLYGRMETFESKLERLKQLTGESLSEDVGTALGGLGGFIDSLSEMDSGTFDALVSGLEVVAVSGPGILAASAALRLIGTILTPGGAIALGVTALAGMVRFLHELDNLNLEKAFGTGEIDHAELSAYLAGIGKDFDNAYSSVNAYNAEVETAISRYKEASEELTSGLLTDLITQAELTPQDIEKYFDLGDTMREAVLLGLQGDADAQAAFWTQLFGNGDFDVSAESSSYQTIIDTISEELSRNVSDVESTSQQLRDAMTSAFDDGKVSDEEYQKILSYVRDLNEAVARAEREVQDREDEIAMRTAIGKAQTQSYEDMVESTNQITTKRDEKLSELEADYLHNKYDAEIAYENGIEYLQGILDNSSGNPYITQAIEQEIEKREMAFSAATEDMETSYQSERARWSDYYNTGIGIMWDTNLEASDHSEAYGFLENLAQSVANRETNIFQAARDFLQSEYYDDSGQALINGLTREIEGMGGAEEMISIANAFMNAGDIDKAGQYILPVIEQMIAGGIQDWSIFDGENNLLGAIFGDNWLYSLGRTSDVTEQVGGVNQYLSAVNDDVYAASNARTMVEDSDVMRNFFNNVGTAFNASDMADLDFVQLNKSDLSANIDDFNSELSYVVDSLKGAYDLGAVFETLPQLIQDRFAGTDMEDVFSAYQLMYGGVNADDFRLTATVDPVLDESAVNNMDPVPISGVVQNITTADEAAGYFDSEGFTSTVTVDGDTENLASAITDEDGRTLTEYVGGDASDLHVTIWDEDSQTLTEYVAGNPAALDALINSYNGRTIYLNVVTSSSMKTNAEGGRATSPEIFGEAGPEWAIPEAHTQRTAELLNAAREASGFTWPDLISRFGGLNANPVNSPSTIVYSPVINAADASGVSQALEEDKERFRKLLREERMMNEMEVYA